MPDTIAKSARSFSFGYGENYKYHSNKYSSLRICLHAKTRIKHAHDAFKFASLYISDGSR